MIKKDIPLTTELEYTLYGVKWRPGDVLYNTDYLSIPNCGTVVKIEFWPTYAGVVYYLANYSGYVAGSVFTLGQYRAGKVESK